MFQLQLQSRHGWGVSKGSSHPSAPYPQVALLNVGTLFTSHFPFGNAQLAQVELPTVPSHAWKAFEHDLSQMKVCVFTLTMKSITV